MIYIIDLREEQELAQLRIISKDENVNVITIPARYIFANVEFINKISKKNKVYLLCKRGIRSCKIKSQYFPNNPNVQSISEGLGSLDKLKNQVEIIRGDGGYGMEQHLLLIFAIVLVSLMLAIYMDINKLYILAMIGLIFGVTIYLTFYNSIILSKKIPYKN